MTFLEEMRVKIVRMHIFLCIRKKWWPHPKNALKLLNFLLRQPHDIDGLSILMLVHFGRSYYATQTILLTSSGVAPAQLD
jgi:hypothetical protein